MTRAWTFGLLRKVVLRSKLFKQSVKIVEHEPVPTYLAILIKIFPIDSVVLIICSFWAFDSNPTIALNNWVSNQCTFPLSLVLLVCLESLHVTLIVYGCEVWDTCQASLPFVLFPPAFDTESLLFGGVNIDTQYLALLEVALSTGGTYKVVLLVVHELHLIFLSC